MTWEIMTRNEERATKKDLDDLIIGAIGALVIAKFYPREYCVAISQRIDQGKVPVEKYRYSNVTIGRIGVAHIEYAKKDKTLFFANAKNGESALAILFANLPDPAKKIREFLARVSGKPVAVANEGGSRYCPAVVRIIEPGYDAPIHRDKISIDAPHWEVGKCATHLSSVLHFQDAEEGGELVTYRRLWEVSDEENYKIRNGVGYEAKVVDGVDEVSVTTKEGDLVLLNPGFYHRVNRVGGKRNRIAMGFFFGMDHAQQRIVAWA